MKMKILTLSIKIIVDDYNLDSSQNLNIASSSEINLVRDSVHDQFTELKKIKIVLMFQICTVLIFYFMLIV